jgi:hypothetical protein
LNPLASLPVGQQDPQIGHMKRMILFVYVTAHFDGSKLKWGIPANLPGLPAPTENGRR